MPFGDPLAPDGALHVRLQEMVEGLFKMGISLKEASSEIEKLYIELTLSNCHSNRTQAARRLGIHRNTLNTKIELYRLNGSEGGAGAESHHPTTESPKKG